MRPGAIASEVAGGVPGQAAAQVETALFRALTVLRVIVLTYAVVLGLVRLDEFARPGLALLGLGVLVVWTAVASWAYDEPRRRRLPLFVLDLAVSVGVLVITPLVQSEAMLERHASTLPSFFVMTPVLAWAASRHWAEALAAAAVVSVADLSVRVAPAGITWGNIFLLFLAAGVVAYTSEALRQSAELRAATERAAAAQAERARLARAVHDGVLQVLGLVQRVGADAEGDLGQLSRLAAEQERRLRALVQDDARSRSRTVRGATESQTDLVTAVERIAGPLVSVSAPVGSVMLPAHAVEETAAAVAACLDNVRRHVGETAPAWVLVEDLGHEVVVTVRDEGPGIAPGRLEQAQHEGRLGVSGSIVGRMHAVGGRAQLTSSPGSGVEWELTLLRREGEGP